MIVEEPPAIITTTVIVERADITGNSSTNVKEEQIEYFEVVEPIEYEESDDESVILEKYTETDDEKSANA